MRELGFLADDLTGASDVLAQAHAHGLEARLVLDPAHVADVKADVIGLAGPVRSLSGGELDRTVRAGIATLSRLDLSVLLYKVCSTFDSSPTVGSIGRGIELLHEAYPTHGAIPVVPAQPGFGRYTAFSQHFGRYAGQIHRLDRHPVMTRHPSTPMTEADLRLVLAEQLASGARPPGLHLDTHADGTFDTTWSELRARAGLEAFVVDAVDESHMDRIAAALIAAHDENPALVVGSGGIMAALARARSLPSRGTPERTTASGPVLAVSASASRTTAAQIDDAVRHGWVGVAIPPEALGVEGGADATWTHEVERALDAGRDVVAHATLGPDDPRLTVNTGLTAEEVGGTIGRLAGVMARRGLTRDVVVCGGDTSSHALAALDVRELGVLEQFVTAGPICETDHDSAVAGCRLLLKGGQVGPTDLLRRFAGKA